MSIARMSHIELVAPRNRVEDLLVFIQDFGSLQLEEVPLVVAGVRGYLHREQLDSGQEAKERCLRDILRIVHELELLFKGAEQPSEEELTAFREELPSEDVELILLRVSRLKRRGDSLWRKRNNMSNNMDTLSKYREKLGRLIALRSGSEFSASMSYIALMVGAEDHKILQAMQSRLAPVTQDNFKVLYSPPKAKTDLAQTDIALLAFPVEYEGLVRKAVRDFGLPEFRLPRQGRDLPLMDAVDGLQKQLEELPAMLADIEKQIDTFKDENFAALLVTYRICADSLARLDGRRNLAHSEMLSVAHAWLPAADMKRLRDRLDKRFEGEVMLTEIEAEGPAPQIPVRLHNAGVIRSFEHLVRLFSAPMYGSLDPTPIMAILFPLFFGMILGDGAYGLGILGLAYWAKRRFRRQPVARDIAVVAMCCGAASVVFGVVYGEFLGDLPARLGHHAGWFPVYVGGVRIMPLWAERKEVIDQLLLVTVGVGLTHVVLGLVLGIFEGIRRKNKHHAGERIGLLLGLLGIVVMLLPAEYVAFLGDGRKLVGLGLIGVGVVALLVYSGPVGPMELISLVANVLSYSRIMALGVAGMVIADLANKLGAQQENIFLMVLVSVPVHILAVALGVLEPTVHALRLHYVEFLPKFFEGNGRTYVPLTRKGSNS